MAGAPFRRTQQDNDAGQTAFQNIFQAS